MKQALRVKEFKKDGQQITPKKAKKTTDIDEARNDAIIHNEVMSLLKTNKDGEPYSNMSNIATILENDPNLKDSIRFNTFELKQSPSSDIIWRRDWDMSVETQELWTDADTSSLLLYLDRTYGISNKAGTNEAMAAVGKTRSYHPVRDYLNGVKEKWDGVERVDTFFHTHLGVVDNELNRKKTRMLFKGAIRRVFEPGIKFDIVTTLMGTSGIGKSLIIEKLANGWVNSSLMDLASERTMSALRGSWLIELAENAATKKSEVNAVKQFLTSTVDKVRLAYGTNESHLKRQSVFIGTDNNFDFIKDSTTARRYTALKVDVVPVKEENRVGNIDQDLIDQVWAEAMYIVENIDDKLYFSDEDAAKIEAENLRHTDFVFDIDELKNYLDMKIPSKWWDKATVFWRRNFIVGDEEIFFDPNRAVPSDIDDLYTDTDTYRNYICLENIAEDLLGYDRGENLMKNQQKKKEQSELANMMMRTPGWRLADPDKGDPKQKRFPGQGAKRRYYVREEEPEVVIDPFAEDFETEENKNRAIDRLKKNEGLL